MVLARRRLWLVTLVAVALARQAAAHLDPPSSPTLFVRVEFHSGQLAEDQDDGFGDAELLFVFKIGNTAHGQQVATVEVEENFDETSGAFSSSKVLYEHLECSPTEPLAMSVQLVEVDTFGIPEAVSGIAGAAAELSEDLSPLSYLFGIISGLEWLNGDDDLGEATLVVEPWGATVSLRGADGGCDFSVVRAELVRDAPPCSGRARPGKSDKKVASFKQLGDAALAARGLVSEPGNPEAPTPAALADLGFCVEGLAADLAQLAAAASIDEALALQGVDRALAHYETAAAARAAGDVAAAIDAFGLAHRHATQALDGGRDRHPRMAPAEFPLDVLLAPGFISTTRGSTLTVGGAVVGREPGQDLVAATVLGIPPGATAPAFIDGPGSFRIEVDLPAVALGTHDLLVQLQVGSDLLVEPLRIAVHQD